MKVINCTHTSELDKYVVNLDAGVTTWSFKAENTDALTKYETTNCTLTSIAGGAFVAPYNVVKDTYYSIVIVPINNSLPSSITFYSRKNTSNTFTSNGINLNNALWNGGKLYILTDTQLLIFDAAKFDLTNYLGSGAYTNTPYVETITLPTQPSGYTGYLSTYWHDLIFVKHTGGSGKMLIGGKPRPANGDATVSYSYYFLFDVVTKEITDLAGVSNQLTRTNTADNFGTIYNILYDYVNELIYPVQLNHSAGQIWRYFNLPYTTQALISDVKKQVFAQVRGIRNYFNPTTQSFSGRWWAKIGTNTYTTQNSQILGLGTNSGGYGYQYNYKDGYYYMQSNSITNYVSKNNSSGNNISTFRYNPDVPLGPVFYLLDADIDIIMSISIATLRVGWAKLTDTTKSYNYIQSTDVLSGQTAFKNICSSKAAGVFFTIGTSGVKTRLYAFKCNPSTQTMDTMYYDLPDNITVNSINTNQLLK